MKTEQIELLLVIARIQRNMLQDTMRSVAEVQRDLAALDEALASFGASEAFMSGWINK
jgi:hypothetical protein